MARSVERAGFFDRVERLPRLGIGLSTEYGARRDAGLDPVVLRERHPTWGAFLEVGIEAERGLDADALGWVARGWPTTYHFLDINLDEPEDFDAPWLARVQALIGQMSPAWMCGDAGLWHFGPRERGHMLLLPPILTRESASAMATGIRRLRAETGLEILPENPPGTVYVGDLSMLEWMACVAEEADTGLLLDLAHLAIYQQVVGRHTMDGLADFPAERVVELHVAGGVERVHGDYRWIEDQHGGEVRPEVWQLLDALLPRLSHLKAVVLEAERNPIEVVTPLYERLEQHLQGWS